MSRSQDSIPTLSPGASSQALDSVIRTPPLDPPGLTLTRRICACEFVLPSSLCILDRDSALSAAGEAGAQIFGNVAWKVSESRLPIASRQFCSLLHVLSAALLPPHTKIQSSAYFSQAVKKNLCLLSFDSFLPGPVHWRRRSVHTLEARGS